MSNDSLKQELIQEKSVSISTKYHCQTGILTPFEINEHGLYIIGMEICFFFCFVELKKKLF
jgi:hypothetical protein